MVVQTFSSASVLITSDIAVFIFSRYLQNGVFGSAIIA